MLTQPPKSCLMGETAAEVYLLTLAKKIFGADLRAVLETDSFVRQPCYSARSRQHFYFILHTSTYDILPRVAYLQGEFQEFTFAFLTEKELSDLPLGDRWPYATCRALFEDEYFIRPRLSEEECTVAVAQAAAQIGHIARNYYLTANTEVGKTWAIRQLGWALRYADLALVHLSRKLAAFAVSPVREKLEERLPPLIASAWIPTSFGDWVALEKLLGTSEEQYREVALSLNDLVQSYSAWLAEFFPRRRLAQEHLPEKSALDAKLGPRAHSFIDAISTSLSDVLLGFFIHGSTARGEASLHSDLDSLGVFTRLDSDVLERIRLILQTRPSCSVYTISHADLCMYPDARYSSMSRGPLRVAGNICLVEDNRSELIEDTVQHNLATIRQIARSYLCINSYGPRAIHLMNLMMKLSHHGVMRPLKSKLQIPQESSKEELLLFFSKFEWANPICRYLQDSESNRTQVEAQLLAGNTQELVTNFNALLHFAVRVADLL